MVFIVFFFSRIHQKLTFSAVLRSAKFTIAYDTLREFDRTILSLPTTHTQINFLYSFGFVINAQCDDSGFIDK